MLLILGSDLDPNARRIVDHAHLRSVPYRQLDCEDITGFTVRWGFDRPEILIDDERIAPKALYLRHNVFSEAKRDSDVALFTALQAFGLAHPGLRMMNRESSLGGNNKSSNLALARSLGFTIPTTETVVSTKAIGTLFDKQDKRIAKPMEGGDHCVPVHALDRAYPTYRSVFVQQKLPGRNVRLFVIDGECFAFELKTTDLDYRTDPNCEVAPTDVPVGIEQLGKQLASRLKFDYCALDFRADEKGNLVFLEINSFPMFVAFDNKSENALAEAQLRFLCQGWFDYPT